LGHLDKFFESTHTLKDFLETLQRSGVQSFEFDGLKMNIGKTREDIEALTKELSKSSPERVNFDLEAEIQRFHNGVGGREF